MSEPMIPLSRGAKLLLPDPKYEERLAIKMSDFARIRHAVRSMRDPIASASNWATTFVGAFLAFGIAWISGPRGTDQHLVFGISTIGALILAVFMGWVEWGQRKSRADDRERICKDMDSVEAEAPRLVTETAPVSEEGEGGSRRV